MGEAAHRYFGKRKAWARSLLTLMAERGARRSERGVRF
jgi:hypothetical protein